MDLASPASLLSGLFIGMLGTGFFMYGKRAGSGRALVAGVALCVIPIVVSAVWAEWAAAAACIAGFVAAGKLE